MKFGLKGAAVFAALGVASFTTAPDASAIVPMDEGTLMTARAAEIISDVYGENDARVITVRMPDGEQFVIRDWSAGMGPVRRVTERDFDKDGDLELRVSYRDGRVVEVEDVDIDFDLANGDAMALLGDEGVVVWDNEIAGRLRKETEITDVNSYRSSSLDDDSVSRTTTAPVHRTYRMNEGDLNESDSDSVSSSMSSHESSSMSSDVSSKMSSDESDSASIRLDSDGDVIWDRDMGHSVSTSTAPVHRTYRMNEGDMNEGDVSSSKETEFVSGSVDNDVHMSDVNSYRSSSSVNSYRSSSSPSAVDRTYVLSEGETSVSRTNSWTPSSVDLDDASIVDEVFDKVEDAGDMSVSGVGEVGDKLEDVKDQSSGVVNEVADKTEDGWDMTKRGAGEVADKTEDAWDHTKSGVNEVGDKLEDAKDQSTRVMSEVADKTEDGWDHTKKGAVEVADKLEDAKDESVKLSKKRNVVSKGVNEVGDKLEDIKDFFTGDDGDDDDR